MELKLSIKKHIKLNLPVVYRDSDEGDLNDIKTNNIGFFVMCTSPGGATTASQRKTAFQISCTIFRLLNKRFY